MAPHQHPDQVLVPVRGEPHGAEQVQVHEGPCQDSRIAIEQAKGFLANRHDETPDDAFVRMRTYCRAPTAVRTACV